MNERNDLIDLLTDVLTDHCTPELVESSEGGWSADLWKVIEDLGLTSVGIPEEDGGNGGELDDAVTVVRTAGRFAAPVPIVQTLLVAPALRRRFGLGHRPGPSSVAWTTVTAAVDGDEWHVTGTISDVSYPEAAAQVLVLAVDPTTEKVVLADVAGDILDWTVSINLAGEPRGTAVLDLRVNGAALPVAELDDVLDRARDVEALGLTWSMVGAMEKVQDLTVTYVTEREQFGRPISKFQAVKQLAAQIAGLVSVSRAAAIEATAAMGRPDGAPFAIAASRARTATAATDAVRYAHQLHGAIGYTREYPLHQYSRRIWSWRDEGRSAIEWTEIAGERAVAQGADKLWETLTR